MLIKTCQHCEVCYCRGFGLYLPCCSSRTTLQAKVTFSGFKHSWTEQGDPQGPIVLLLSVVLASVTSSLPHPDPRWFWPCKFRSEGREVFFPEFPQKPRTHSLGKVCFLPNSKQSLGRGKLGALGGSALTGLNVWADLSFKEKPRGAAGWGSRGRATKQAPTALSLRSKT